MGFTTRDGPSSRLVAGWATSQNNGLSYPFQFTELVSPWTANTTPTMSDGTAYLQSAGGGVVIGTGWDDQVAYFTPAWSVGSYGADLAMDIVVAVSNNGGINFNLGPSSVLSDLGSSGAAVTGGRRVFHGRDDGAWQYARRVGTWESPKSWIRRVHFRADGTLDLDPIREVRVDCDLNCVWLDNQNIAADCSSPGFDDCTDGSTGFGSAHFISITTGRTHRRGTRQTKESYDRRMERVDPIRERSDALHRRLAKIVRRDPQVIARARETLEGWIAQEALPAWLEWRLALTMLEPDELASFLESDTPRAQRMRCSSPFTFLARELPDEK